MIGAGNVATNFAMILHEGEKKIVSVYSRNIENARLLADKVSAEYTNDLKSLPTDADVYIIAVSDSAIKEVVSKLSITDGLLLHTAGSVDMNVLKDITCKVSAINYGVLYPLQALSMNIVGDFYNKVPLYIEANNAESLEKLTVLAKELSAQVKVINSDDRKVIHLAAVFVNNFTNYMYVAAGRLLKEKDLPFSMLMPIISETVKILERSGADSIPEVLTGPAVRKDMETIRKHIDLLKDFPDLKRVYETITQNIIRN